MKSDSFIYFQEGSVRHGTNDGMELLGHFLRSQAESDFFIEMVEDENQDRDVAAGPYFVETLGDMVYIEHLEHEDIVSFETTRKNMLEILKKWKGFCGNPVYGACHPLGKDIKLLRETDSEDNDTFTFETTNATD